jgi:hypothetical protein
MILEAPLRSPPRLANSNNKTFWQISALVTAIFMRQANKLKNAAHSTLSLPKYRAYNFFRKSNDIKFDHVFKKEISTSRNLEYQINTIILVTMSIFIWYIYVAW